MHMYTIYGVFGQTDCHSRSLPWHSGLLWCLFDAGYSQPPLVSPQHGASSVSCGTQPPSPHVPTALSGQVLVLAIFFRQTTPTPALEAAGLISAVIGLVLFLDGLRVAIMPMALLVGTQLPKRLKLPWVLLVAFCLGVLVTYAEPAIAAIRPLAALVDPHTAPYLYYMMNQQQEIMVFAIGTGVGVAAVIGTLKFLYGISLKILIAAALLPTIGAACYMQW